jgi:hypothetical protein
MEAIMRAPSIQSRILAFAPIQLCAWASAAFFGYNFWHGEPVFWPLVITVAFLLNVIRAHEQVQTYRAWKREWDAMSGVPPRVKRGPNLMGVALGVPFLFLLYYVGQRGGVSAILGVIILTTGSLLAVGLVLKLTAKLTRRKASKVLPVTVCVSRAWLSAPDIKRAYRDLPAHCRAILRTLP